MATLAMDSTNPLTPDTPTLTGTLDPTGTAHATLEAFTDFVAAWHRVDPNGTWSPQDIYLNDRAMAYLSEGREETFPRDPGADTYALIGWDFTETTT